MNKQQLAQKIWESANQMRSKIEANEYKDYILGFIFYKYVSDKQVKFLKEDDFTDDDIKNLTEEDTATVKHIQRNLGYFISYKDLFSTWIEIGKKFDVSNVRDALSAFSRSIYTSHKKVFDKIFNTLQTGLSKLGDSSGSQTKAVSGLLQLIKDIPMDGKQDYDVLGFIYEYLISMFAANAGKKAGEFYTPHEVSLLMSEIVANHLKGKNEIKIYDPTSGSGSLLINIGNSVSKYISNEDNIKYYAQEIKENTYNLTRMNLVMRGIKPDNIVTRNGDTLEEDWPYFEENKQIETYDPLYVDAVVSNPPYSQDWDPSNKETDPRYSRFGLAPKGKADYAFLLHDLFHIKQDGIMTIILPHGVLFRGGEEGTIRKNLIESNHIDAIIGLPANIFFGTGIPTIIIVLKQKRDNDDVLIIDASRGFIKEGKNNKLRASDIKRIADVIAKRKKVDKFSKVVNREEIRSQEYNLNIPRYVDSSEKAESWDLYASMHGGIPMSEIDGLKNFWTAFPELRKTLFTNSDIPYVELAVKDIKGAIKKNTNVIDFENRFKIEFESLSSYMHSELIDKMQELIISQEEIILSKNIFKRLESIELIDRYEAYQLLDNEWVKIAVDLEIIKTEGFEATKKVDPNMVTKKKDGKDVEVQDGWVGHIIPFDLIHQTILKKEYDVLKAEETKLAEIVSKYDEIIDSMSEEEKDSKVLNDSNDSFVSKEIAKKFNEICKDIKTDEIKSLNEYTLLSKKEAKLLYSDNHQQVSWDKMELSKDGTYSKNAITGYVSKLQSVFVFDENSFEYKIISVSQLMVEEKKLKAKIKKDTKELHNKTKETIEGLSDEQVIILLDKKWIEPLVANLHKLPDTIIDTLVNKIQMLSNKYASTYKDIESEIRDTENLLSSMLDDLVGDEFDMKGIDEFKSLLKGE